MLQRACIACYSTPNFDPLWLQFKNSLAAAGFQEERIRHKLIHDEGAAGFQKPLWYRSVKGKMSWFAEVLNGNPNCDFMICCDVDICFPNGRQNGWDSLASFLDASDRSIFLAREPYEGPSGPSNTGFIVVKRAWFSQAAEYLGGVASKIDQHIASGNAHRIPLADQSLINDDIKQGRIPYDYLPADLCSLGGPGIRKHWRTAIFHHAIAAFTLEEKLGQLSSFNRKSLAR